LVKIGFFVTAFPHLKLPVWIGPHIGRYYRYSPYRERIPAYRTVFSCPRHNTANHTAFWSPCNTCPASGIV